jgi:glucose-1-phosphate thymidylyltransferase
VKAVLLAAGYATRLRPLTETIPKQLLPVGGRPMLDWILDKVQTTDADELHVVSNSRFADDFRRWATGKTVQVHDDGTTSNEDRLGALGDLQLVRARAGLDDDLLVIAGDNLFDYSLRDYVAFWRAKRNASCVAVYDVKDVELARRYAVVDVDRTDRVVAFVEKPAHPRSTLCATATYLFARAHARMLEEYLAEGNPQDAPGNFVAWLYSRVPVYAYAFGGDWFDIGDHSQLLEADNRLRRRHGLAERRAYSLD